MTRRLKLKFDNVEDEVLGKLSSENNFLRLRETISKNVYTSEIIPKSKLGYIIFHNFLSQL